MNKLIVIGVLAVVVLACGKPEVGDSCSAGTAACDSATTALFCANGSLRAIPCKGPGGCIQNSSTVSCDSTRNIAGDACAPAQEGLGQCSVANTKEVLKCTSGTWTVFATCPNACTVSGGNVGCT